MTTTGKQQARPGSTRCPGRARESAAGPGLPDRATTQPGQRPGGRAARRVLRFVRVHSGYRYARAPRPAMRPGVSRDALGKAQARTRNTDSGTRYQLKEEHMADITRRQPVTGTRRLTAWIGRRQQAWSDRIHAASDAVARDAGWTVTPTNRPPRIRRPHLPRPPVRPAPRRAHRTGARLMDTQKRLRGHAFLRPRRVLGKGTGRVHDGEHPGRKQDDHRALLQRRGRLLHSADVAGTRRGNEDRPHSVGERTASSVAFPARTRRRSYEVSNDARQRETRSRTSADRNGRARSADYTGRAATWPARRPVLVELR